MRSTSGLRAGHSSTKAGGPAHLTLLPVGFAEPRQSPAALVVSYTALSPLPRSLEAVCSLWHCPAGHPGWALPTTVPCGVRTFLDACAPRSPGRLVRRSGYAAPTIDPVSVLPSTRCQEARDGNHVGCSENDDRLRGRRVGHRDRDPHRGCRVPQATQIRMHGRPSRLRMPANGFAKGSSRGAHNVPRLAE